jgi:hypothetical protein
MDNIFTQLLRLCYHEAMITYIFGIISGLLALVIYAPYGYDIVRGRVRPSRATRIMLTLVLIVALWQQQTLGSGWALAVTVGELLGSIAILFLSLKHGIGGWQRSDIVCYGLLAIGMLIWLSTGNALAALHVSVAVDAIACWPTLIKTWRLPDTETPIFYIGGIVAAGLSLLAQPNLSYGVLLFPVYLMGANAAVLLLIYRLTLHRRLRPR